MTLQQGTPAPDVEAENQAGRTVAPDFEAPTVVYFYPRDGTPGCQLEARQFDEQLEDFRAVDASVYGVSTDGVDDHREFADEEDLDFELLADPEGEVADAFDVALRGDFADRITFVLADEEVQSVVDADDMNPDGHAAEVLAEVEDIL